MAMTVGKAYRALTTYKESYESDHRYVDLLDKVTTDMAPDSVKLLQDMLACWRNNMPCILPATVVKDLYMATPMGSKGHSYMVRDGQVIASCIPPKAGPKGMKLTSKRKR
jgi:hypothetical protein